MPARTRRWIKTTDSGDDCEIPWRWTEYADLVVYNDLPRKLGKEARDQEALPVFKRRENPDQPTNRKEDSPASD
jgi:hypothetical protein